MKTYFLPVGDSARQVTFKQLQSEAALMLAHIAKDPFQADQVAQEFSGALFRLTRPESPKNAENAAMLIGWAVLLSVAVEEIAV